MLRALSGVIEKMHFDRVFSAAPFHTAKRWALPPHYAADNVYFKSIVTKISAAAYALM